MRKIILNQRKGAILDVPNNEAKKENPENFVFVSKNIAKSFEEGSAASDSKIIENQPYYKAK